MNIPAETNFWRIIIIVFLFYFLSLFQSSFFFYYKFLGIEPNYIMILAVIFNLFEKNNNFFSFGFFSALIGGFFLDIFSSKFFGFNMLILLASAVFIKLIVKKYVRIPFVQKT